MSFLESLIKFSGKYSSLLQLKFDSIMCLFDIVSATTISDCSKAFLILLLNFIIRMFKYFFVYKIIFLAYNLFANTLLIFSKPDVAPHIYGLFNFHKYPGS